MGVSDGWYQFDNDINAVLAALLNEYVVSGGVVTEKGVPDMSVDVAAITYYANGQKVVKVGVTNVAIAAADGTNPRKDIIVGDSAGTLSAVAGTPAAAAPTGNTGPNTYTPVPPNIPANKVLIAEVWVETNETTILDADITDRRVIVNKMEDAGINVVHSYAELQAVVTDIGAAEATIYAAPATYSVAADYTIPANIHLIIGRGAVFSVATTKTLTIKNFKAGMYQIFDCVGTGKVALGAAMRLFPEWWGAYLDGSNVAATTQAIKGLIASCKDGDEMFYTGHYSVDDEFRIAVSLRNAAGQWTLSGFGVNEYYYNPGQIAEPVYYSVMEDDAVMVVGALGALALGERGWGDNGGEVGFDTVYVRLSAGAADPDPDLNAVDYIEVAKILNINGLGEGSQIFQEDTAKNLFIYTAVLAPKIDNVWLGSAADPKYSIRSATYKWTQSPATATEYYLELAAGGDPGIDEPPGVLEDSADMHKGTLGSLVAGEWNWGNNDALGFDTVYVRLTVGGDPDLQAIDFVEALTGYSLLRLTNTHRISSRDLILYGACFGVHIRGSLGENFINLKTGGVIGTAFWRWAECSVNQRWVYTEDWAHVWPGAVAPNANTFISPCIEGGPNVGIWHSNYLPGQGNLYIKGGIVEGLGAGPGTQGYGIYVDGAVATDISGLHCESTLAISDIYIRNSNRVHLDSVLATKLIIGPEVRAPKLDSCRITTIETDATSTKPTSLDYYEEGDYTVVATVDQGSVTIVANKLWYTKIGDTVHVQGFFNISALGAPNPNWMKINLPFTSKNVANCATDLWMKHYDASDAKFELMTAEIQPNQIITDTLGYYDANAQRVTYVPAVGDQFYVQSTYKAEDWG